jgi:hypothetical protein
MPLATEAFMLIAGRLIGLDEPAAREVQPGMKLSARGRNSVEVVSRGEATPDRRWFNFSDHQVETPLTAGVQVPVLVRASCSIAEKRCQVGGADVEAGLGLTLYTSAGKALRLDISDAVGDGPTAGVELRVRFAIPAESVALIKQGDRARRDPLLGDRVPVLLAVAAARSTPARVNLPPPPGIVGGGEWSLEVTDDAALVDATVRLRADLTSNGLQYRGRPLRVGAPFVFEHDQYVLRGWIRALRTVPGANDEREQ